MKKTLIISMVCGLALVCASANAQPGGFGGGMPPMGGGMMGGGMMGGFGMGGAVDMTELAEFQAKQLTRELNLTPQQEKKIAKINKKELDRRMNHYLADGGSHGGFGGMMGGMPPMGGGMPPMGGGMPPMMGGGFPGFPGADAAAANPDEANDSPELKAAKAAYNRLESMEDTKADIKAKIKIEKQMMKVLTEEQYQKWVILQQRPEVPGLRMRGVERRAPGAEFNLDALPEEAREAIKRRMESGEGFPGFPGSAPAAPEAPATPEAPAAPAASAE